MIKVAPESPQKQEISQPYSLNPENQDLENPLPKSSEKSATNEELKLEAKSSKKPNITPRGQEHIMELKN